MCFNVLLGYGNTCMKTDVLTASNELNIRNNDISAELERVCNTA
jgi:hypothetical protein